MNQKKAITQPFYVRDFFKVCFAIIALFIISFQSVSAARCIRQDFDTSEAYQQCMQQENAGRADAATTSETTRETGGEASGLPTRTPGNEAEIYSKILNPAIIVLSAAVVLAVTGSIVVAGIQYSTANGNSSTVATAKNRIVISVVVLILYIFGFAILQWLIPGGIGS